MGNIFEDLGLKSSKELMQEKREDKKKERKEKREVIKNKFKTTIMKSKGYGRKMFQKPKLGFNIKW